MNACLLWVLCVVRKRSLRRTDYSPIEVLPTVVRRCVWSRNLVNEKALDHWVLSRKKKLSSKNLILFALLSRVLYMYDPIYHKIGLHFAQRMFSWASYNSWNSKRLCVGTILTNCPRNINTTFFVRKEMNALLLFICVSRNKRLNTEALLTKWCKGWT